jgi:heme-degrading monooxygenase HmoA
MIAVIFEVIPQSGRAQDYLDRAAQLKSELERVDGFISVERFASLATEGKFLSLSFWRDETAVRAWRENSRHRAAQHAGRSDIFADYHLRIAHVVRDYGMFDRAQAPADTGFA